MEDALLITRTIVAAAGLLLATSACSGEATVDEPLVGDEHAAATALSTYLRGERFDEEQSDCIADRLVRDFGLDHLEDLGVIDDKLEPKTEQAKDFGAFASKADAPRAASLVVDCVTPEGVMKQQYQGIDDTTAACIAKAFGRDRLVAAMAAGIQGVQAADTPDDVTADMNACVPKE